MFMKSGRPIFQFNFSTILKLISNNWKLGNEI